jgi:hypothetical protein
LASQIESPKEIKGQLVIMATQKFFIDTNLELTDAHLTILAPIVEVVSANRLITMRGSSGESRCGAKEAYSGWDGQHGYSSGEINIFALDLINAPYLQIQSFGGTGADGQAGGKGIDGKKSNPPFFPQGLNGTAQEIRVMIQLFGFTIESWTATARENTDIYVVYNQQKVVEGSHLYLSNKRFGVPPSNGRNGGKGGAGAVPGHQNIILANKETKINLHKLTGKNGAGGRGGSAGSNAPFCVKTFFVCNGLIWKKNLLGFIPLGSQTMTQDCSLQSYIDCDNRFSSAYDGNNGSNGNTLDTQAFKHAMNMTSVENYQAFEEIVANDLSLEKRGIVKDFLNFLVSQQAKI